MEFKAAASGKPEPRVSLWTHDADSESVAPSLSTLLLVWSSRNERTTEEERTRIFQKAGFTDADIQEMQYRRERILRGEKGP